MWGMVIPNNNDLDRPTPPSVTVTGNYVRAPAGGIRISATPLANVTRNTVEIDSSGPCGGPGQGYRIPHL
jgi:hypothetical protein